MTCHTYTVKATFNTPCELVGGLPGEEAKEVYESWGYNPPSESVETPSVARSSCS